MAKKRTYLISPLHYPCFTWSSFLLQSWHKSRWMILRKAMDKIIHMMKKRGGGRSSQRVCLTLHYPPAESLSSQPWTVALEQTFRAAVSNAALIHTALMGTAIITKRLLYLLYFKHQPSSFFTFPWRSLSNLRWDEMLLTWQSDRNAQRILNIWVTRGGDIKIRQLQK